MWHLYHIYCWQLFEILKFLMLLSSFLVCFCHWKKAGAFMYKRGFTNTLNEGTLSELWLQINQIYWRQHFEILKFMIFLKLLLSLLLVCLVIKVMFALADLTDAHLFKIEKRHHPSSSFLFECFRTFSIFSWESNIGWNLEYLAQTNV